MTLVLLRYCCKYFNVLVSLSRKRLSRRSAENFAKVRRIFETCKSFSRF